MTQPSINAISYWKGRGVLEPVANDMGVFYLIELFVHLSIQVLHDG